MSAAASAAPDRPAVPGLRRSSAGLFLLALLWLAGCEVPPPDAPPVAAWVLDASARPEPVAVPEPSALSTATRTYFAGVQQGLLLQGLLRTDRGGPDTPFTDRNLVDNFVQIALYDEYVAAAGTYIARKTESRLRRWDQPVRLAVEFGATVPEPQRVKDSASIAAYGRDLATASGHPVSLVTSGANFHVLVLNEDDRLAIAPRLHVLVPGISDSDIRSITALPRSTFCLVLAYSGSDSSTYGMAVAIIRGEHPDLLRLSCIHEELAQGLGLANDSPTARPSIFNDDEEFALLTRQDALMLKILYDPRLSPGMTEPEARPIVQTIAYELLGGES